MFFVRQLHYVLLITGNVSLANAYCIMNTVMATHNVMMKATNHLAVVSRIMQKLRLFKNLFTILSYSHVITYLPLEHVTILY